MNLDVNLIKMAKKSIKKFQQIVFMLKIMKINELVKIEYA